MEATTADEREEVAKQAGTTVDYLWQLAGGHRKPSVELAKRLEAASKKIGKHMRRHELRSDIWDAA